MSKDSYKKTTTRSILKGACKEGEYLATELVLSNLFGVIPGLYDLKIIVSNEKDREGYHSKEQAIYIKPEHANEKWIASYLEYGFQQYHDIVNLGMADILDAPFYVNSKMGRRAYVTFFTCALNNGIPESELRGMANKLDSNK